MTDFTQEIKRLQKLSCIALSPEQEQKLWKQLTDIIGFLGQLPETKMNNEWWIMKDKGKLTLRTIAGIRESSDSKKILKNVKHTIINNSIVIKSVLN
jgi:aspartyl/glutamyl-tRNA(Asn/Gln) amidotransferase C subunit